MYMWDQKTKTYKDLSQLAEFFDKKIMKASIEEEIEACILAIECHENEIKKLQAKIEELSK